MTRMSRPRWGVLGVLGAAFLTAGCGEDETPVRSACDEAGVRLALEGEVGPTRFSLRRNEPFGGRLAETHLTPVLDEAERPHVLFFTSNTPLDVDLWTALLQRLSSAATDAATLTVATRPATVPCDPRDGQLCASYGVDTNGDGSLLGSTEVIYPITSGEARLVEVTGNVLAADFDLTFGPATSGDEAGDEAGGRLQGCFIFFRSADRRSIF
jgi:hypothetical protein